MAWQGTNFKHEMPSRVAEKKKRHREEAEQMRVCYRAVDLRDGYECRVCKRACATDAVGMLKKAHHHHIEYRSKGGEHTTDNVLRLCAECHEAIHRGRLRLAGDADQRDPLTKRLNGVACYRLTEQGWQPEKWC
jgi:Pyruvate/2-oxoacid:ferredoxin oxidoreductase delta subunit